MSIKFQVRGQVFNMDTIKEKRIDINGSRIEFHDMKSLYCEKISWLECLYLHSRGKYHAWIKSKCIKIDRLQQVKFC